MNATTPRPVRVVELEAAPLSQLLGDAAVLRGAAAVEAYRLLIAGVRQVTARDGIQPHPVLLQMLATVKAAAALAAPRAADIADIADVRDRPHVPASGPRQQITIEEVAAMCGVGSRQARRLAPSLGGTKSRSGRWVFDRQLVEAYLAAERGAVR